MAKTAKQPRKWAWSRKEQGIRGGRPWSDLNPERRASVHGERIEHVVKAMLRPDTNYSLYGGHSLREGMVLGGYESAEEVQSDVLHSLTEANPLGFAEDGPHYNLIEVDPDSNEFPSRNSFGYYVGRVKRVVGRAMEDREKSTPVVRKEDGDPRESEDLLDRLLGEQAARDAASSLPTGRSTVFDAHWERVPRDVVESLLPADAEAHGYGTAKDYSRNASYPYSYVGPDGEDIVLTEKSGLKPLHMFLDLWERRDEVRPWDDALADLYVAKAALKESGIPDDGSDVYRALIAGEVRQYAETRTKWWVAFVGLHGERTVLGLLEAQVDGIPANDRRVVAPMSRALTCGLWAGTDEGVRKHREAVKTSGELAYFHELCVECLDFKHPLQTCKTCRTEFRVNRKGTLNCEGCRR